MRSKREERCSIKPEMISKVQGSWPRQADWRQTFVAGLTRHMQILLPSSQTISEFYKTKLKLHLRHDLTLDDFTHLLGDIEKSFPTRKNSILPSYYLNKSSIVY